MIFNKKTRFKTTSIWVSLLLILIWADFLLAGAELQEKVKGLMTVSCPDQLTMAEDANSRSHIAIRLDPDRPRCRVKGIVGGEHISYIGAWSGEFSWFKVNFKEISGSPMYVVDQPEKAPIVWSADNNEMVIGPLEKRFVIISLSAYSFLGEYEIWLQGFTEQPELSE